MWGGRLCAIGPILHANHGPVDSIDEQSVRDEPLLRGIRRSVHYRMHMQQSTQRRSVFTPIPVNDERRHRGTVAAAGYQATVLETVRVVDHDTTSQQLMSLNGDTIQ